MSEHKNGTLGLAARVGAAERALDEWKTRAEKAEAHVGRIIDAVDCQMKATGLPQDLVDVVRGVAMETNLTTWRLAELERVCREQQARADSAAWSAQNAQERVRELDRGISEVECAQVLAERERDEVGLQLAAAQDRLLLAMACIEAGDALDTELSEADIVDGRLHVYDKRAAYQKARAALDAVPGDALKKDGE